ncbi:hypothetical protein DM02DRAFT_654105 [Periconia macrospinosa]|uniref:Uncharacterized protein n=1 Tax=Periconia macrospinosa TaxID=97972 RepID=A0A2V1DX75_9PLEO|nr:hypothetical protein DM02DRAFT_654105 [Periconia macrospinosa]
MSASLKPQVSLAPVGERHGKIASSDRRRRLAVSGCRDASCTLYPAETGKALLRLTRRFGHILAHSTRIATPPSLGVPGGRLSPLHLHPEPTLGRRAAVEGACVPAQCAA